MSGLISSLAWVRRGAAQQHPQKYLLDDHELQRVSALARIELEDAKAELQRAQEAANAVLTRAASGADEDADDDDSAWVDEDGETQDEDGDVAMEEDLSQGQSKPTTKKAGDLSEYNLDTYDEDDANEAELGPFTNVKGLTYYRNNDEDPYITLKDGGEDDDEREELEVLPTDNLIVVAKTQDEISQIEVYVYDESQENLYAHHDLMLPNFPLCLEWLDFPPAGSPSTSQKKEFGNYIAVGTMDPEIEVWSLDMLEGMYPDTVLGRPDKTTAHVPVPLGTGKKKKKSKHRATSANYHVDAVLSLSWNRTHRNLLASASADRTIKLWDLSRPGGSTAGDGEEAGGAIRSFNDVHKDKIQALQWNDKEPTVLLSGSYDRTVRTFDSRAPESCLGAVVGSDVEALRWDPWDPYGFYVSLENGLILNFDARTLPSDLSNPSPSRFTLSAHDGAASALDVNPHVRGVIVTGGTDKIVKVWNVVEDDDGKRGVSLVTSRDLGVGKVFSTVWSPDDPLTLAAGGSAGQLQIWDIGANQNVRKTLSAKLTAAGKTLKEKESGGVVSVADDGDGDSDIDE
ncbi:transducin family protein/WD-40 repeat family protein [Thelephora terrestris]|uniref:Transducin family protein/WD-40 repeat family protein n=1 Tax=Thelephora terrestris TaxID=56493 RepID=A0A9P6H3W7_9AGAM|nr:transducin family protein/WD-40 repeat family protein [Thelephora terrestris]